MAAAHSLREEIRYQLRLALPLVVVQVGLLAMGFVDGAFMGRVSKVEFGAVSLGHTWTFLFLIFALGVLTGLDPIVSQAFGARDRTAMRRAFQRGVVLALVLSIPVSIAILPAEGALFALGQPAEVVPRAAVYARILILSVPPFLIFVALRQSMQAMHRMRALVIVILLANGLNAFLDWVFINGNLGFDALGSEGCAWATVISRWAMVLALPLLVGREVLELLWPLEPRALNLKALRRMLGVGLPIGIQFTVEVGAFQAILFLMGKLGTDELTGHQVAMHLASASFMVPLGMSMAASVRVGNEIGRGSPAGVRRAIGVSLVGGAGVMAISGALFLLVPLPLARIITNEADVLAVAVVLLPLAGLFQVFDGTQVVANGCLRGMADTRVPMFIHVVGFWAVGVPVGSLLAFPLGGGAQGLWGGLVVGLFSVALVQLWRLRVMSRRGLRRLVIDEPAEEPLGEPDGEGEVMPSKIEGAGG